MDPYPKLMWYPGHTWLCSFSVRASIATNAKIKKQEINKKRKNERTKERKRETLKENRPFQGTVNSKSRLVYPTIL